MIEHVLQVVTDAQIEKLNAILERMRVVAEQGQYSADEDQLFHQVLYENVNNLVVRKILDVFWAIYRNAQKRVAMPQPTNPMATYLRHVAIVRALEAHDLGAMQQAVAQHRIGISTRVRMLEEAQTLQPET
jgi:DNA-binding FadR family transcriptional regulator